MKPQPGNPACHDTTGVRPGNLADAIELIEIDLDRTYPGADFTVVIVAEVRQDGQEPLYQVGGGADTPVEQGERIVRLAGEATRHAALLRKIQRVSDV